MLRSAIVLQNSESVMSLRSFKIGTKMICLNMVGSISLLSVCSCRALAAIVLFEELGIFQLKAGQSLLHSERGQVYFQSRANEKSGKKWPVVSVIESPDQLRGVVASDFNQYYLQKEGVIYYWTFNFIYSTTYVVKICYISYETQFTPPIWKSVKYKRMIWFNIPQ